MLQSINYYLLGLCNLSARGDLMGWTSQEAIRIYFKDGRIFELRKDGDWQ